MCFHLPFFFYYLDSILRLPSSIFWCNIPKITHKNACMEAQALTFSHDVPNPYYILYSVKHKGCVFFPLNKCGRWCIFTSSKKENIPVHFMHFHSVDSYPFKKRQNVKGFPRCILDRLQPDRSNLFRKWFDMHLSHDLVKCKHIWWFRLRM